MASAVVEKEMNVATQRALLELNRRFYARYAASFSASRERPWHGWERLLDHLAAARRGALRVLDVGCGNGRFATFLAARRPEKIFYLGVDSSPQLLAEARRRLSHLVAEGRLELRLLELEVTADEAVQQLAGSRLGRARLQLITLFGVLHHIPGRAGRARLLARLALHLAAPGLLAVSLWCFDRQRRISDKILPWEEYNRRAPEPIDLVQLERGDHLLTWAGERDTPRYCHLADEEEIAGLITAVGLPCRARFAADGPGGDHNLYLVFGAQAEGGC